jgi:hypothetical protein
MQNLADIIYDVIIMKINYPIYSRYSSSIQAQCITHHGHTWIVTVGYCIRNINGKTDSKKGFQVSVLYLRDIRKLRKKIKHILDPCLVKLFMAHLNPMPFLQFLQPVLGNAPSELGTAPPGTAAQKYQATERSTIELPSTS